MSLQYISERLTICIGTFLLITGIIGNGINIWIFSSRQSYRTTPCTFYFLIGSICNILVIVINLLNRLLTAGYGIDFGNISNAWCKIRNFSLVLTSPLSITCSCLAIIDQFFATSRNHSFRRYSQIKLTYYILIIAVSFWILHGIPYLLFYNISSLINSCINTNSNFGVYTSIYFLIFLFLIPISVMILFGWLTYQNIQQTIVLVNQNVDYQLVKMTLFQVGIVIVSFLPFGLYNLYALITQNLTKDYNRILIERFILMIMSLNPYIFHSISCYTFLVSSRRFRQTVKNRLMFWKRENQIIPQ